MNYHLIKGEIMPLEIAILKFPDQMTLKMGNLVDYIKIWRQLKQKNCDIHSSDTPSYNQALAGVEKLIISTAEDIADLYNENNSAD